MPTIARKSIRISSITESLLKSLRPELAHHGAGYIVDVIANEQSKLPAPLPPDARVLLGQETRAEQLRGKPALNPKGRKPKSRRDTAKPLRGGGRA